MEADPVRALQQALRDHPAPAGLARQTEETSKAVPLSAGDWPAIGRHTDLAATAWHAVRPTELTADERWSVVADVAALAETVTVLDQDLLVAAAMPGRGGAIWPLQDAVRSGLRLAAREAAATAAAGPLPNWDQPTEWPALPPVTVVRSPLNLPVAQDQLVRQLDSAVPMRPQSLVLVATAQARFLAAAAASLTKSGQHPELARWAADLSRRVGKSVVGGQHLLATGPRLASQAVEQSREIAAESDRGRLARSALNAEASVVLGGSALNAEESEAVVSALARTPRVLGALARQADRGWRSGTWLVADPHSEEVKLIPVRKQDREPQLSAQLSAVAAHSVARPGPVVSHTVARDGPASPRGILAKVGRERRPVRPGLPSERSDGQRGRG